MLDYKRELKKSLSDLGDKKTFYKQIPNLLTVLRTVGLIPMNILFLTGNLIPGFIVLGLLLLTDFFDGKIARKYNITSSFGASLDAISDKIMALLLMIPLLINYKLIILNLVFEGLISYVNIKNEIKGGVSKTNNIGKCKTWLLSLMLLLGYGMMIIDIPTLTMTIFSLGTMITEGVTLSSYIYHYKKNIDFDKKIFTKEIKTDKVDNEVLINSLIHERELLLGSKMNNKKCPKSKKLVK